MKVLCIGLDPAVIELLSIQFLKCELTEIPYDLDRIMLLEDPAPLFILCGQPPEEIATIEIAQMLSMQYKNVPLHYTTVNREGYNRKLFIKNGFSDAYLIPFDGDVLKRTVNELLSQTTNTEMKTYRSVKLIDIEPGVILDFDINIYLAMNNRYVKYSNAGEAIDQERLSKLNQHRLNSVYVPSNQMQEFYQYTADRLRQLKSSQKWSETEKKEKLQNAVRDLMSGIFNDNVKETTFEQAQGLMQDCKAIVNQYILSTSKADWYLNFLTTMGEKGNNHVHASNVSTYAAMFSIGLGVGDPAELAIAGMFHDIGLVDVPIEIADKKQEDRTREGQELYQKHPEFSVNILKRRKLNISPCVANAILQHHENFNGTGYPNGLVGPKISKEAQILALADQFDELTRLQEGVLLMTPVDAIEYFRNQMGNDPGKMIFDPEILKKVLNLFPRKNQLMEVTANGEQKVPASTG